MPTLTESLTIAGNVSYHYLDSGAVSGSTYTTLVFIHGMGFNAGVFKKLLPLATAHDLRIVCLYRRDYNPTTSFRDEELATLTSGTVEGQEGFYRSQGVEIATFLAEFAVEQSIPPAQGTSGGIALIGWSMGSLHAHAVVAYLDALPPHVLSDLGKYLHTVISQDMGGVFVGIANPPEYNIDLWFEPDAQIRLNSFYEWATAHFTHKSVTSGNIDDLEFNKFADKTHSMHELSSEELAELTSVKVFGTSDTFILFTQLDTFKAIAKRALFTPALAQRLLPNLHVRYMAGGTSSGLFIWVLTELRKLLADPKPLYGLDAETARDVKMINLSAGNHFNFWDEPEAAITSYIATINL